MNRKAFCFLIILNFAGRIWSQANYTPYTFITLAGSGGTGTQDGYGNTAGFGPIRDVTVDGSANVYVADTSEYTIRRITPQGLVSTIAGTGGLAGTNDGIGAQARFSGPQGVVADQNGNLFVADSAGRVVRMLTSTVPSGQTNWKVVTIAGQPDVIGSADGTNGEATFSYPRGLAVDAAGNLYVTDFSNNNLRKMTPQGTNWVVTTLAGQAGHRGYADGTNTAALFSQPTGIAVDANTNLYIADLSNDAIRKVSQVGTNWVVTTIAGQGAHPGFADGVGTSALFNLPNGIALGNDGNLYVAEYNNDTIRRLVPTGTNWSVSTLAGLPGISGSVNGTGSGATFNAPAGVALDVAGNVYIGDVNNHIVRKGWMAGTTPLSLLAAPAITSDQISLDVTVVTGLATNFTLVQSSQLDGPWITDAEATVVTTVQNVYYQINTTIGTGQSIFYRVQIP
jgi:sugar lactone lactonase YvrE